MRLRLVPAVIVMIMIAVAAPARAGGWWSYVHLEGPHIGIGEFFTARAEVWWPTIKLAEKSREIDYHAYLVRGIDREALNRAMSRSQPERWWSPPEEMVLVGDVELRNWDGNIATAVVPLSIPEVPPGRYLLMLCDAGCQNPLGNLVPRNVLVSADALAARTARRLDRINFRLEQALVRVRDRLRHVNKRNKLTDTEVAVNDAAIRSLNKKIASIPTESPSPTLPYVAFFTAGLVTALMAMRLRRRSPQDARTVLTERIPDDVSELVGSARHSDLEGSGSGLC